MEIINLISESEFNSSSAVFKPLDENDHYRRILICLKKNQVLSNHKSPVDSSILGINGRGIIYDGQVPHEINPGILVKLNKNNSHKIEASEDCVLLLTQTPHPKKK